MLKCIKISELHRHCTNWMLTDSLDICNVDWCALFSFLKVSKFKSTTTSSFLIWFLLQYIEVLHSFQFFGQEARRRRLREEEVGIGRHYYRRSSSLVAQRYVAVRGTPLPGKKTSWSSQKAAGRRTETRGTGSGRIWKMNTLLLAISWLVSVWFLIEILEGPQSSGEFIWIYDKLQPETWYVHFVFKENLSTFNLWARWPGGDPRR